jgi:YHS domain-containing protein
MNMPLCVNEVDPVCGMALNSVAVVETSMLQGKVYGFCSKSCKETFEHNLKKYTDNLAPPNPPNPPPNPPPTGNPPPNPPPTGNPPPNPPPTGNPPPNPPPTKPPLE